MYKYLDTVSGELKEYLQILEPKFPAWLDEYIAAPELQRIGKISMFCGKDYSVSFGVKFYFSNLDHSVAVALILWHFTHDKKQTLAGLFHDIATPVFKHCIDMMNGDAYTQESTESQTEDIIKNSKTIMSLLKRDGIKFEEVCDYKIYPLADSPMPGCSADRFEYNFSNGLSLKRVWELDEIKDIYSHALVGTNEKGDPEFAFDSVSVAEDYISHVAKLWPEWMHEPNKVYMQFLADMCASVESIGKLTVNDLYTLSEQEVISKIENCGDSYLEDCFHKFRTRKRIDVSPVPLKNRYSIKLKCKRRYIVPLVKTENGYKKADKVSPKIKAILDDFFKNKYDNYGCLDLDFVPYTKKNK